MNILNQLHEIFFSRKFFLVSGKCQRKHLAVIFTHTHTHTPSSSHADSTDFPDSLAIQPSHPLLPTCPPNYIAQSDGAVEYTDCTSAEQ